MKSKLEGKRVILRPLRKSDLSLVVSWLDEPKLAALMEIDISLDKNYQDHWFKSYSEDDTKMIYAITVKRSGRHVGNIAISDYQIHNRLGHLTVFIGDTKDRKKGYAREAMLLFLDYCFEALEINRIYLTVNVDNLHAIRLYEYCGFSREGLFRKKKTYGPGHKEQIIMSVANEEFRALKYR